MKKAFLLFLVMPVIGFSLLIAGCDTESASSNNISINPSSAAINEGESVTFEASGGYDYSWSMSEPTWGTLSSRTGNRTTYTSTFAPSTNTTAHQILTVTSTIEGSSTVSDTNTAYGVTSEVYVEHISSGDTGDGSATLAISPTSASVSQWSSQEFTASGGSGTYSWSVAETSWGSVSSSSGTTISYTSIYDPGNDPVLQTITVTDSDGSSISATITQTE